MRTNRQKPIVLLQTLFLPFLLWNAQPSPAQQQEISVNIGISTAKPTEMIQIPVTLSGPEETPIGKIVGEVAYPKDSLIFKNTELGLAGESSDAEIKAEAKNEADLTVLDITVTSKKALKSGILAYFNFDVPKDAKKGSIALTARDIKASSAEGSPVELAKGKDGEVTVFNADETIPVLGCFFFTH